MLQLLRPLQPLQQWLDHLLFIQLLFSQNALPEDSFDFLMCRMFHKNIRRYVKVEFASGDGVQFSDFLRAGITLATIYFQFII